jgi:hypothetical protein
MDEKIYPGIKATPGPMSFLGVLMALAARPEEAPDVLTRGASGTHRLHLTKYRPTRAQRKVRRRMQRISRRRNRA